MSGKIVKKWINNIVSILLIAIVALLVFFVISSKISGGGPRVFGKELLTVLSGSMEPGIQTGSVIAINPAIENETFEVGDVITYRSVDNPNVFITHRIVEVQEQESGIQYITKGDNNDAIDSSPIPAGNIVGKYADFTIPLLGYIFDFVKSKVGTIVLIIIPGLLMIGYAIVSVWKAIASIEEPKPESPKNHG